MRKKFLVGLAATVGLLGVLAAPGAPALAAPEPVTYETCWQAGGAMTTYDAAGVRHCAGGTYDGAVLNPDPVQGWCQDGYHIVFVYLQGLFCRPNLPNT
ncbi:hypothetical protein GCM10010435_24130 [Winogradskya consettensis]|uniref:Secreted protein n=1 Tax=Winogradskya consettensis TaxID=113560 RepID=A0A919T1M1_9ACTN|nr:hypothetical protein [Actinoplanes consettensis]GIM82432.1 hypothetical protein Aco04nite_81450 [Actinoplanes consettensis]